MIVLDTHALLWWVNQKSELPQAVLAKIKGAQKEGRLALSAMSFWEVAMLCHKGRLLLGFEAEIWIDKVRRLPLLQIILPDVDILMAAVRLSEKFPKDPVDRIIAATALVNGATLITKDARLRACTELKSYWN